MITDRVDEAREEMDALNGRIKRLRMEERFAQEEGNIDRAIRLVIARAELQEREQAIRLVVFTGGRG